MDWLSCIRNTVIYLEAHLCEDVGAEDAAKNVYVSPFFLQKGFSVMTGCGIGEYLRNRRLYEAALELKNTDEKVIDIALKYCYETPESFTKAFSRFHKATPSQVRAGEATIRVFLPFKINVTVYGGEQMDYK